MQMREYVTFFGGVAALPVLANARPVARRARIRWLGPSSLPPERQLLDVLRVKMLRLGYVEGGNLAIECRWEGHGARLSGSAGRLAWLEPNAIVTTGTPGTRAAKDASSGIPIVFASSGNPVNAGSSQASRARRPAW